MCERRIDEMGCWRPQKGESYLRSEILQILHFEGGTQSLSTWRSSEEIRDGKMWIDR